jgi:ribosomal-protein-alanine N-acetyltransferase
MADELNLRIARLPRESVRVPDVDKLARATFDEGGVALEEELSRPWSRVWFAELEATSHVVGFLVSWHVADELHILNVATDDAHRRRGIGSALLRVAIDYATSNAIRILLLEVRRSNRAAIRLYRAFGFSALGIRPKYYSDNDEDAVEMILALDPLSGRVLPGRDEVRIDA